MINLDFQTLSQITSGELTGANAQTGRFTGVSIDSRTVKPQELFCAIRGEQFDGHSYVSAALANGAAGAVVDSRATKLPADATLLTTKDTHQALIDLATWYRKRVGAKTIGITGSVGKTTVKEMIAHLLQSAGANFHVSAGNLNNLYGLPLSLLRMDANTEYGVFELGISLPGEMSRLAPILQPNVAVITNIAAAHLESLGTVDGVRKEKLSLLDDLAPDPVAIVNIADNETLAGVQSRGLRVVTFGAEDATRADFSPKNVKMNASGNSISFELAGVSVTLPLFGKHHATNAACALAACKALGVDVDPASLSSLDLSGAALRGEQRRVGGSTFIMDCYNASPVSVESGFQAFMQMESESAGARVALLADMLELGESSIEEHRKLGVTLASRLKEGERFKLVTVGDHARYIGESMKGAFTEPTLQVVHVGSNTEAVDAMSEALTPGSLVYVKGSRGMALENVVTMLEERILGAH